MRTAAELGMLCAIEKLAYGGGDTGYEYGRWLDGGFPYEDKPLNQSRQRIIDMTKTLSDAAKARGASVKFYGDRYDDPTNGYSADEAVKRLMAAKEINDANESSMPNYYFMDHPRKPRAGLAELLRLKTPDYMEHDEAFPAGTHPLAVIHDKYFKKPKTDASTYKEMTKDVPAEFKGIRDDMHSFLKETAKTKQAEDLPNVFEGAKKVTDTISPTKKELRAPTLTPRTAQDIVNAMALATKYDALKDVNVGLGANKLKDYYQRMQQNPRVWNAIKATTSKDVDALGPFDPKAMGDFYEYRSNSVNLPSKSPGILVHELGHAVDFNEHPSDSYLRGLAGGTYRRFAPTLWKEHAAWNKGKNRFLEGAAMQKLDPKLVQDTLQSMNQTRPIGLGSYWGARLGSIAGGGLGLAGALALSNMNKSRPSPVFPIIGSGLGMALGVPAGMGIGRYFGHAKERASAEERQNNLNIYAQAIAKKHGISPNEALEELNGMLKAVTKKKKAA